jgi:adenylosuccinate synthase
MKTAYLVVDLGFGDAGKGGIVDYLAQSGDIHAVVRYTGGPHAAHHVVRADGVSHAFCQFGATFNPAVRSHLAHGMIVKPENLLYEGRALEGKGLANPFARLSVDPGCRLVTTFHAMLCQMKETARGEGRFGSVGIGAGEAVRENEEHPEQALRVGDLYQPKLLKHKLYQHFEAMQQQAVEILRDQEGSPYLPELREIYASFCTPNRIKEVLAVYQHFSQRLPISLLPDSDFFAECNAQPGDILFEGAHAALLDRERGYFPYVAKTDTTTSEALRLLNQAHFNGEALTLGVVRAYGYRHGPGPFVTEDRNLTSIFEERHNKANEWQGKVRYGWFDLLAIRHGLRLNRRVDALALTMLDHLARLGRFQVCTSYAYLGNDAHLLERYFEYTSTPAGKIKITGIKPTPNRRTDELSRLLFDCAPLEWRHFEGGDKACDAFIRFLESPDGLGLPVQILSNGPKASDKRYIPGGSGSQSTFQPYP